MKWKIKWLWKMSFLFKNPLWYFFMGLELCLPTYKNKQALPWVGPCLWPPLSSATKTSAAREQLVSAAHLSHGLLRSRCNWLLWSTSLLPIPFMSSIKRLAKDWFGANIFKQVNWVTTIWWIVHHIWFQIPCLLSINCLTECLVCGKVVIF